MSNKTRAVGIGALESALKYVLTNRKKAMVFLDTHEEGTVFKICGTGPEQTGMLVSIRRYRVVGTYAREFDPEQLKEDAKETVREFNAAPIFKDPRPSLWG